MGDSEIVVKLPLPLSFPPENFRCHKCLQGNTGENTTSSYSIYDKKTLVHGSYSE